MKKSSLYFGLLLGALIACGVFAVILQQKTTSQNAQSSTIRELKIAHSLPTSHPVHQGVEHFRKRLEELSGGAITCNIFPNNQLGKETEYLEKLQTGSLDIAKTSAAPIGNFVPRMKVLSLPYLFRDREHYWQTLDSEIGQGLLEKLSDRGNGKPSGIRGLCYFDAGSRNFYSMDPVKSPEDLKGKIIRVMGDSISMKMVESFDATPKSMGGGEIYGALEKGVINGAENNPPTFIAQSHYEVCKHFTFDHHSRIPDILNISNSLWDQLSDQEKSWFMTAAKEASQLQRKLWEKDSKAAIEKMKAHGVTIHHPDTKPFEALAGSSSEKELNAEQKQLKKSIREIK